MTNIWEVEEAEGIKHRLWRIPDHVPLVRETADPIVFSVLALFVVVAIAAFALATTILPHDHNSRSHILQLAAGLLLVFGAYYTSLAIRERRAEQYLNRLTELISQLESSSDAVRIGAIGLIKSLALETPALPSDSTTPVTREARAEAILGALDAVARENRPEVSPLAAEARADLVGKLR
jgi:hypothetical protein